MAESSPEAAKMSQEEIKELLKTALDTHDKILTLSAEKKVLSEQYKGLVEQIEAQMGILDMNQFQCGARGSFDREIKPAKEHGINKKYLTSWLVKVFKLPEAQAEKHVASLYDDIPRIEKSQVKRVVEKKKRKRGDDEDSGATGSASKKAAAAVTASAGQPSASASHALSGGRAPNM